MVKKKPVFDRLDVKIEKIRPSSDAIKDYITDQHAILAKVSK